MPKNKVLTPQARKMVYDVNNHIKKESQEIIGSLKEIKSRTARTTTSLQKDLKALIQTLELHKRRAFPEAQLIFTELCDQLEQIGEETAEVNKLNENNLEEIIQKLGKFQNRTALATNTSVATVRRIVTQADSPDLSLLKFLLQQNQSPE